MAGEPDALSIVVYSGSYDRVHYALAAAAAAAAIEKRATLFFTMDAIRALGAENDGVPGWAALPVGTSALDATAYDAELGRRGVARFEELVEACRALNVTFMVCEMGLRAIGLEAQALRSDIAFKEGGLVTFLRDASGSGAMMVI